MGLGKWDKDVCIALLILIMCFLNKMTMFIRYVRVAFLNKDIDFKLIWGFKLEP